MYTLKNYFESLITGFLKYYDRAAELDAQKQKLIAQSKFKKITRFVRKKQEPFLANLLKDYMHFVQNQKRIEKLVAKKQNPDFSYLYLNFSRAVEKSKDNISRLVTIMLRQAKAVDLNDLKFYYKKENQIVNAICSDFESVINIEKRRIEKKQDKTFLSTIRSISNIRLRWARFVAGLIFAVFIMTLDGCWSGSLNTNETTIKTPLVQPSGQLKINIMDFLPINKTTDLLIPEKNTNGIFRLVKSKKPESPYAKYKADSTYHEVPRAPPGYRYIGKVKAMVTAYTPDGPGLMAGRLKQYEDGNTATMTDAYKMNGCAVDPSLIPYNSMLYIPGQGFRIADDTGGRIKKHGKKGIIHIDLRVATLKEAKHFGVKKMEIPLYEKVSENEFVFAQSDQ